MTCRSCGAPLDASARFCPSCGAPAEASCKSCGASLQAGARFCASCGAAVGAVSGPQEREAAGSSAVAAGSERKIASIVFADLVGFTSLNETTDPELVQALVARAFERLSAEAARYEGTIEKFAGDAMLAIFGVPIVHEDDAERAVRAALEMQAAMLDLAAELRAEARPELALRVGVETGEVLVDLGRVEVDRDRMVTGDAVNTAARLQQVAQPGEVLVGSSTYAVTRELVEYEELPPVPLKGKSLPVAAWRAIAVKARRGGRRAPLGIEAPLIGRDEEIALLKETVHRTAVEGRPHLVTVLGSAGVGKSRLTWELEKYLDGLPETYVWRKGRCLAYAQSSYSAFSDAVRADAKILQDDASEAAEAKLDARLLELAGPTPTDGMADALRAVLGLGKPAGLGRDELFDAWRRYLELLSRQAPLVLVQEDVHWADEGLLDFLEYVARWSEGPIVLLCLARHELLERRPTWGGGLPNAATIVLEPLAPDENARMFDRLLDGNLPTEVRDRVVSLADGNPLFTEELVRMFVDKGVVRYADGRWELARRLEDIEIPGSIQAVLAARLDTLPPAEKRATQDAAVVGRIFWDALIAHLMRSGPVAVRDTLRRLRVKELVVPREPSMLAGAAEFGFRHVLTRDVAYESLPKRQRAAKHLDVARWAEETLADRTEEMVELLASHYLAALRYEEELGGPSPERLTDLRRQTYTYARRAGARASDLHQLEIAARWLAIAIEQAARLEVDAVERASLALEFFHGTVGNVPYERQLAILQEAVELMEARDDRTADDDQLLGRLRAAAGYCLFQMERLEDARSVLQAGIAALEGPPSAARAELRHRLGWTYWRAGPIETSLPLLRLAVDEAHAVGAADVERWAIHELGVATSKTGDVGTGLALVQESFKLAQDARDHTLIARCHINVPALMNTNGMPWSEWGPIMKAGLETSRRAVDRSSTAWTAENLGDAAWERGTIREAIAYYQEGLEAATALRDELKVTIARLSIGWMHYFMGDYGVVQAVEADRARLAASNPEAQAELYEAMWVAWRRWREDDPPVAIAGLRAAIESAEDVSEVHAPRLLARQALRAGDREALVVAEKYILGVARTAVGPLRRLDTRWVEALRRGGPGAVDDLARIASEWESMEYRLIAADVFADAALIAARDGIEASQLIEAAIRLYAECEVVPVLGPLPEERWVEPPAGDAVAASA